MDVRWICKPENKVDECSGTIDIDGQPYYVLMVPNKNRFNESCMRCHSTPDRAPKKLVDRYGAERSFNKTLGAIPSVFSLRIPLSAAYEDVYEMTGKLGLGLFGVLIFSFALQWLLTNRIIVVPVKRLSRKVRDISNDANLLGKPIPLASAREIKELSQNFNRLSKQLKDHQTDLNATIDQRTSALRKSDKKFRSILNSSRDAIYQVDVTALYRSTREKQQLERRLQQTQKMETIGTLAGGIAHDFNNILFPISGHAEILLTDVAEDDPARESINEIYTGAMRAKELVNQILTFSRQESTELKLMKIQHIIKEALKLLRSTIPTTIEIKQHIRNECAPITADPTQIHQIIMNLVTNAYHAMEENGGVLTVALSDADISGKDDLLPDMVPGLYVCLIVGDTGMGMTHDLIDKIFNPFFTTKEKALELGVKGLLMKALIMKDLAETIRKVLD